MNKQWNSVCAIGVIALVLATTGSAEAQLRTRDRERERSVQTNVTIENDGAINRTLSVSGDGPTIRLEQQGMRIALDIGGDRVFERTVSEDWAGADIRHNGERVGRLMFADGGGFVVLDTGDQIIGAPNAVWTGRRGNVGTAVVAPGGQILYNDVVRGVSVSQPRTMMGITMVDVEPALAAALGLEEPGSATVIGRVSEGLAADRAGLKTHDVIIEIEGEADASRTTLIRALREREDGDELALTIMRAGKKRVIEVELDAYDGDKLLNIETFATTRPQLLREREDRVAQAGGNALRLGGGARFDGDEWRFYTPYPPSTPREPNEPGVNRFFLGDAEDAFAQLENLGVELDGLRELQQMIADRLEDELSPEQRAELSAELATIAEQIGQGVRQMVQSTSALESLERLGALGGGLRFQIETDGEQSEIEEFVFPEFGEEPAFEMEAFEIELESLEEQLHELEEELEERDERTSDRLDRIERLLERLLDQR